MLKALSLLYLFTDESFRETAELSIARSSSTMLCAGTRLRRVVDTISWSVKGRSNDPAATFKEALDASHRAVELDPRIRLRCGGGPRYPFLAERPTEAVDFFNRRLRSTKIRIRLGYERIDLRYQGRPDEALERLRNVWRLSPYEPMNFYFWIVAGIAEFVAGRYDEAIAWLKSQRANPGLRLLCECSLRRAPFPEIRPPRGK